MKNLIKLQMRNVFNSKLFYVCLGISLLMCAASSFLNTRLLSEGTKMMPQIVSVLSGLDLIGIIFVVLFSCYDFNDGTTKNIVARGYSKTKVLLSKYIVAVIAVLVMYLAVVLLSFILYIKNGIGYESGMTLIIINSIISIIASVIFYSTMSFLLEKNGSAIVASLFVPTVITMALGLIDSRLNINISRFWLENISSVFVENPSGLNLLLSVLQYLLYIVFFVVIGIQVFKKKEIK